MTLTNLATGIVATTVSESTGAYQFLNVRVGTYRIEAEIQGFSKAVVPSVTVTVNARQRVDLTLKVGGVGETVEVTGARMLESESSDRGQVIGREQIVNLPLNGRAYADLALLSPGVRQSSISSSRDASFNVNGMRSSLNNFILDGVDNNSYGTSNQGFSNQVVQVSPDAVEEFKVQTNNFSAEFGRAGGAVINATFRSGTNDFHGTAWEFNRNTSLNATGFFKPSSGVKPELSRNQYGGVFGGPILRNRVVLLRQLRRLPADLQHRHLRQHPDDGAAPGPAWARPIVNPLTGAVYADGVIPASAITPFARSVLDGLPAPTRAGVSNNFDSLPERTDDNDKVDVKVDQQFGSQTSGFVRFSHRKVNNFEPPPIPGETSSPSNAFVEVLNQQLALGVTRTLSSRSLLEVRFGLSRTKAGKTALGTGTPNMFERYGITGLPTEEEFAGGLTQQSVTGWTAWGRQNSNPQFQDPLVQDWRINYSTIFGTHTVKTGYEYQHINTDVDDVHPKYGSDTYGGQFSRPAGAAADPATYNLADFMFGARNQYDLVNPFVFQLRQRMHFAYVQDDWRVSPALTVNLGLRYEVGNAAVGGRELPDELRSGDEHAAPGARRLGLRSRPRQPGQEQLRAAHRRRLQPQREDGHPRGLRHELRPVQPAGRREPAVLQRSARGADHHRPAAVARDLRRQPGAVDLLPPDPGRLPGRPHTCRRTSIRSTAASTTSRPTTTPATSRAGTSRSSVSWAASSSSTSPTSATAAAT